MLYALGQASHWLYIKNILYLYYMYILLSLAVTKNWARKECRLTNGGHPKLNVFKRSVYPLTHPQPAFLLTFPCSLNSSSVPPSLRLELSYFQCPLFPGHPRSFAKPSSFPLCSAPPNCFFFPFLLPPFKFVGCVTTQTG